MDIIDKIFAKVRRDAAPGDLRAKVLDIPRSRPAGFWKPPAWRWTGAAVLALALVAGAAYYRYYRVPMLAAAFELTAGDSDAAGVSPDSVFVLKSSKNITAAQVRQVIKISPEVDFDVQSDGGNRFTIKPLQKLSGNTVYRISIAEGVAERDYAWAFQVRAPFAALSTFPRNQATNVPVNSTIEVTFNRDDIENPERFFSINPPLDGRFEVHGDRVVFVPAKPMQEKTVYAVTVRQGLTAKGAEQPLGQDIVFSFETASGSYQPYADFGFSQELVHFPPDQPQAMALYSYNSDLSAADVSIYSFPNTDAFVKAYYGSRRWDLGWTVFYRQSGALYDPSGLARVSSFKPQVITFNYQTFFEIPDRLPAGYYLLDMKSGSTRRQAWVLVNDISHYYSLADDNGFAWVYQFSKKSPIAGASIAYYDVSGNRHDLGATDSQGLARFDVPADLRQQSMDSPDYGKPKLIEIGGGGPPTLALVSAGWWYYGGSAGEGSSYWKYVSTDRYTYKLSDTLRFWGVVKGKSQDVRQQTVKVQLRQGGYYYDYYPGAGVGSQDERPVAETESVISPFDTVSGSLSFRGVNPGTYEVAVLLNDAVIAQSSVEIQDYVKPLYQITVTPSKQAMFAGDTVDFNVKAEFYDGTPAGAMTLKYSGYYNKEISGQLALDKNGRGKLTLKPEYSSGAYYPYTLNISFFPALAEEGDITSQSDSSVLVFGPRVYLQASQKYNDSDNFTVTAKANDIVLGQLVQNRDSGQAYPEYIGNPSAGLGLAAEVEKTEYVQIDEGTVYDPINKISVPQYRYEERKSIVQRLSGTTGGDGQWVFNVSLPKSDRVYYQIHIRGSDGSGRQLSAEVWPYYYQGYERVYYSDSGIAGNNVTLGLGFSGGSQDYYRQFSVGDNVQLTAQAVTGAQFMNGQVLFYRYGHAGIGALQLVSGSQYQEQFDKSFKPAVSYRAVVFGPYGFVESNSLSAAFKQQDANLKINIQPDKDSYRPGDTATVRVSVADKDNRTGDGEVSLSVVDEAVFDVVPYYWQQDILSSLYAVDYTDPRTDASDFTPQEGRQSGGAEGGGCFLPDTKISVPGGEKDIADIRVGDTVLTRANEADGQKIVPAVVQGISRHLVDSYLVIDSNLGRLKVSSEHPLYANGAWVQAGLVKPGDLLEGERGERAAITSVRKVMAPKTMVYNINVGKYHTYFAGSVFVHNAEKGGGYRSEFLDTAHFESKPLDRGQATFTFKLPDNVTSWRATVNAFEPGDILAGQDSQLLPATLPVFVDAVISQTYLAGDRPTVSVRTFGTQFNTNADADLAVDIDQLNYHQTKTARGGSADFELPALQPGNYEMKIKSRQGDLQDGIVRQFSVVGSYFTAKESKVTNIGSGLSGLPANERGYTDVAFTDQGKAQYYNYLLWNQYGGGKRSDQAAAAYLAQKMLQEFFGASTTGAGSLDLSAYQVPGGGLGLFTYGDSDLDVSAELSDAVPDAVYQPQLSGYFYSAMRDDNADIHRIAASLYGLASLGQPVLPKLQLVKDENDLDLQDRLYIAMAFLKFGDKEDAIAYYNQYIKPQLHFEGGQAWFDKIDDQTQRVKLTTLAGAAAARAGLDGDARAVWSYDQQHFPTEDLDVLARLALVRELIARSAQEPASFSYEIGGEKKNISLEGGRAVTMRFSPEELSSIRFSGVRGKPAAVSVIDNAQDPATLAKNGQLRVSRSYLVGGKPAQELHDGDTVVVHLEYSIDKNAIDGGYQVVDFLPSGLRPVTNLWQRGLDYSYQQCSQKGYPLAVDGNRVYFSAYHSRDARNECATYTVEYYARVAAKGSFTAAPPLIQSLQNFGSLNIGQSQQVTIAAQNMSTAPQSPVVSLPGN